MHLPSLTFCSTKNFDFSYLYTEFFPLRIFQTKTDIFFLHVTTASTTLCLVIWESRNVFIRSTLFAIQMSDGWVNKDEMRVLSRQQIMTKDLPHDLHVT